MNIFEKYKQDFLHYLKITGYSHSSIKSYNYCIKFYQKYLSNKQLKEKDFFLLTSIVNYKKYLTGYTSLKGKKLKSNSIYKIFSNLNNFFKYLEEHNYILFNPFTKLTNIKLMKSLPKNIPREKEINQIMKSINLQKRTGLREQAILELLYSTGIRLSELLNLKIYDIDLNTGFVRVTGKGKKDRIIPVGKIACLYIEKYLNHCRPKLLKDNIDEQTLFISNQKKIMSSCLLNLIIRNCLKTANIKNKYSCHSFRHACATAMLKGKANIKHVQEMLGHERLSTTQIYTHVLPLDLLEVHKRTHPSWKLFE